MNKVALQDKYYKSIQENYSRHCETGGDFKSFNYILDRYTQCFQKTDQLIIDKSPVNWCYYDCIIKHWDTKLIEDLLTIVKVDDLCLNKFDSKDADNKIVTYYYFEAFFDFLIAKEKFLKSSHKY